MEFPLTVPGLHEFHVLYHGIEIMHSPVRIEVMGGSGVRVTPEVVPKEIPAPSPPVEHLPVIVKSSINPALAVVGNVFMFEISGDVEDPTSNLNVCWCWCF